MRAKMDPLIICVFASGRGSNFDALLTRIEEDGIPARIGAVVSNSEQAGVLRIARERDIPAYYIERGQFETGEEFCQALEDVFDRHNINFITLAGYLRKIPTRIIRRFPNRMLNIHPALLPDFGGKGMYGIKVHEAVLASGATVSGATIHIVDEEYDHGPIVLRREVPVLPGDTPEILAARVLQVEHQIYADAVRLFAENRVKVIGRMVRIEDPE
jgi:formyltetrahydrofolate-dependent phosphoribosylglycinamide formyltransferase